MTGAADGLKIIKLLFERANCSENRAVSIGISRLVTRILDFLIKSLHDFTSSTESSRLAPLKYFVRFVICSKKFKKDLPPKTQIILLKKTA